MVYDIIFITTFININTIGELLCSLSCNNRVRLGVVVVAQNGIAIDIDTYQSAHTKIWLKTIPNQVNSSEARNFGIDYVLKHNLCSKFVMFPDDDSSFDSSFFENFETIVNSEYCYLTDVYQAGTKNYFQHIKTKVGRTIDSSYWNDVGAVNIILNFQIFLSVGYFDQMMGVAAKYGAGEDSDYFIRSLQHGASYHYCQTLYSYHPSGANRYSKMITKDVIIRFRNYAQGVIYMLCKHKMYYDALKISFKALAGCVLKFITLDFKMSLVYLIAFYERLRCFAIIIFNRKKFYDNSKHSSI